jgi:hypothetical protein
MLIVAQLAATHLAIPLFVTCPHTMGQILRFLSYLKANPSDGRLVVRRRLFDSALRQRSAYAHIVYPLGLNPLTDKK